MIPNSDDLSVCFIILNWNQPDMTGDCLVSLAEQDYGNFHVIVVDNGSIDGSADILRERFPWVTIIELPDNIGYSPANNVGIEFALQQKYDYIFLLNNDTVVAPDMLTHLVYVCESESIIGMTGPVILYFDKPELIWSAGAEFDWRNGAVTRSLDGQQASDLDFAAQLDVGFLSSCAVCIKRQVLEEVGLLDERLFIYYEEADWSARASAAGWRSVLVPKARIQHKVSATMGTASPATEYYMSRNGLLFLAKHLKGWRRIASLARAVWRNLIVIAAYTARSHGGARRPNRDARVLALRDALMGRWGRMGQDVAAVCYPGRP